jgi:hypothetical protein
MSPVKGEENNKMRSEVLECKKQIAWDTSARTEECESAALADDRSI